ncbi:LPXTG cell wall anchor domain-containing protein [Candidatus Woesearchaeota archaeon]|nr:LPXTG cell wall anchor domain-containing protein [Candidatus Woesearchaeota archaeon]
MKKVLAMLAVLVISVLSVVATTTTLVPDEAVMDYQDTETATFCIYEGGEPQDVDVVIGDVCRDYNGDLGCNPGDDYDPDGFTVTPDEPTTGADGCVGLTLETDLDEGDAGTFYYTVNGQVGGTTVGSETGKVIIPEFTAISAGLALLGAGLWISKKRKKE